MSKKFTAFMLALLLATITIFTACNTGSSSGGETTPDAGKQTTGAEKVYRWTFNSDATTLNAHNSTSTTLESLYNYCSSGLYIGVPNIDGTAVMYIGDIADGEPYQVDEEGYVWRINIRENAVWHNGEAINAETFVYSWKMLLDPKLVNSMANFLYDRYIKIVNAKGYYFQNQDGYDPVDWDDVGIKAVDEYTIELTLTQKSTSEYVKRHFTDRSTHPVYEPYYEAGMNEDRTSTTYATTLDSYMGCGAWFYNSWIIDAEHTFVKNNDHWLSDYYHYDKIEIRVSSDRNARVQMFENGELSYLALDTVTLDMYRDDPRVRTYTGLTPYHLEINSANTDLPILSNLNFRKAIFFAIDRETVGELLGVMPAAYYVNHQAPAYDGMSYRETPEALAVVPENYGYDPELAKHYFDLAMEEEGLDSVTIELLYTETSSGEKVMAELFEQTFAEIFGADKFTLTLKAAPSAVVSSSIKWKDNPNGSQLNFNDWGASMSRVFPYAAFNYFNSGYASRPNAYVTEAFDAAFQACDSEKAKSDPKLMTELTAELEKIYLEDVINVPLWQEYNYVLYQENIVLPCSTYVPGIAFGAIFGDIAY